MLRKIIVVSPELCVMATVFLFGIMGIVYLGKGSVQAAQPTNSVSSDRGSEEPEPILDTAYSVTYARRDLSMKPDFVVVRIVGPEGIVADDSFFMPLADQDIVDIKVELDNSEFFQTQGHIHYFIILDTNGYDPMCSLDMPTEPSEVWRFSCASIPA